MEPFDVAVQRTPMFGGVPPPSMFSPFNFNLPGGQMVNAAGQAFLPSLANNYMSQYGMVPTQFIPTQNVYDQLYAQRYHQQQQQAMAAAARQDAINIQQTIVGAQRAFQGTAPTLQQRQQAFGIASNVQNYLPMLSMIVGPDMIDSLMGSRGSAVMLANQIYQAGQFTRDPFSGQIGMSGSSAGMISNQIYQNLYGPGANISAMRGLSAGRAGLLYSELASRGFTPGYFGNTDLERFEMLASNNFSEGERRRIAEAVLRKQNKDVSAGSISSMQSQLFDAPDSTSARIREAVAGGSVAGIKDLAGVSEMLSTSQAQQISTGLKSLSGVVAAMRDVFGDMGRPDAPMREIVNGLQALTQGGLATMNAGQLEATVRLTRNLANQSGIGIQGLLGLQAQAANMADQLGLDRSSAIRAAQGSVSFAGAARDTQRLDIPAFGGLTIEQLTLADLQLRTNASASQVGNQLPAAIRMYKEGLVREDSEVAAIARAAMTGQTTYTYNGKKRLVVGSDAEFIIKAKESGANVSLTDAILSDTYTTQKYADRYATQQTIRALQVDIDEIPRMTNAYAGAMASQYQAYGYADSMKKGLGLNDNEFNNSMTVISKQVADKFFEMDAVTARNVTKKKAYMIQQLRTATETEVRRRAAAAGMSPEETQAQVDMAMANLDESQEAIVATMGAAYGKSITTDPKRSGLRTDLGAWQVYNRKTIQQQQARLVEAQSVADMQKAYSSFGRSGFLQRVVDTLQTSQAGDSTGKLIARMLGGVPKEAIDGTDTGALAGLTTSQQLFQDAQRDKYGNLTSQGIAQRNLAVAISEGLIKGGADADVALDQLAAQLGTNQAGLTDEFFAGKAGTANIDQYRRLRTALIEARKGNTAVSVMNQLGIATDMQIGAGDVSGMTQIGRRGADLFGTLPVGSGSADDRLKLKDAARSFLKHTSDMSETMLASQKDMIQLGRGGTSRITSIQSKQAALNALAKEAGVSPEDLIAGNVDPTDANKVAQARAIYNEMLKEWDEVAEIKGSGLMPGAKGSKTKALGEHEKAVIAQTADFLSGSAIDPANYQNLSADEMRDAIRGEQANTASKRLFATMTGSSSNLFTSDGKLTPAGREVSKMLNESGRTGGLVRALNSRQQLLEIAADKGLVERSKLSSMSATEQQTVLDKLFASDLGDSAEEVERLRAMQSPLSGIGKSSIDLAALQGRLEKLPAGQAARKETDHNQKVKLTGTMRLENPDILHVQGDLTGGDIAHNDVFSDLTPV